MRIRLFTAAIAATLAVVAAPLVAPAPAMAAATHTWYNIPATHSATVDYGVPWVATPDPVVGVGDCTETHGKVVIYPPDVYGWARVEWFSGALRTTHTNNYDQWHQSFTFRTRYGTTIATADGFDGPQMHETYRDYSVDQEGWVHMDPYLWQAIGLVDWSAEC